MGGFEHLQHLFLRPGSDLSKQVCVCVCEFVHAYVLRMRVRACAQARYWEFGRYRESLLGTANFVLHTTQYWDIKVP